MKLLLRPLVLALVLLAAAMQGTAMAQDYLKPCIARIDGPEESVEALAAKVTKLDCTTAQAAFGDGNFLARIAVPSAIANNRDPLVLRIGSVWQQRAEILFVYADGETARLAYSSADTARYITIGALPQFAIPTKASPVEAIYIATYGSANLRGVVVGAQVLPKDESLRQQQILFVLYAIFLGLSLALLAFNFAMWVGLRQSFQLSYCLMVAALLGTAFTSSGAVMLAFEGLDNNDRLRLNYILQALAVSAGLSFMFNFFTHAVVGERLNRIRLFVSGGMIGSALFFVAFSPMLIWWSDRFFFTFGLSMIALLVPTMLKAWRTRSALVPLFILAWSAPIAAGLARALHGVGFLSFSVWLDNANIIALCLEALISIPIIVTRLRNLIEERDGALVAKHHAMQLAARDGLTGLLNRRAFLDEVLGRTGMHRLMIIDIDHFKSVNDSYGHDTGDDVLRAVARALEDLSGPGCLVVRLGGEEFALFMPADAATVTPDCVLAAIRACPMPLGLNITASIGFGDGEVTGEPQWLALYRRADAALYRAKAEGRNRACPAAAPAEMAA